MIQFRVFRNLSETKFLLILMKKELNCQKLPKICFRRLFWSHYEALC